MSGHRASHLATRGKEPRGIGIHYLGEGRLNLWERGLLDYWDVLLHYCPQVLFYQIDHHFPGLFAYAAMEGKDISEIAPHDVLKSNGSEG